jgi:hypothetical protein
MGLYIWVSGGVKCGKRNYTTTEEHWKARDDGLSPRKNNT